MPIQFRCPACRQRMSISRRKAGLMVACPACSEEIQVPVIERDLVPGDLQETDSQEAIPPDPEPFAADETSPSGEHDAAQTERQPTQAVAPSESRPLVASDDDVENEEEDGSFQLKRRVPPDDELDMTPMVDVTFLLLIFFMITASFSLQKSMETEAPEPENEGYAQMPTIDDLADESVIVEIDENDSIFVDDEAVSGLGELEDLLRRKMSAEQKLEMIIEPHYQAKHGTVVAVTDAGVSVGMQRIRRVSKSQQ